MKNEHFEKIIEVRDSLKRDIESHSDQVDLEDFEKAESLINWFETRNFYTPKQEGLIDLLYDKYLNPDSFYGIGDDYPPLGYDGDYF